MVESQQIVLRSSHFLIWEFLVPTTYKNLGVPKKKWELPLPGSQIGSYLQPTATSYAPLTNYHGSQQIVNRNLGATYQQVARQDALILKLEWEQPRQPGGGSYLCSGWLPQVVLQRRVRDTYGNYHPCYSIANTVYLQSYCKYCVIKLNTVN